MILSVYGAAEGGTFGAEEEEGRKVKGQRSRVNDQWRPLVDRP